jgi:hypothetical protein
MRLCHLAASSSSHPRNSISQGHSIHESSPPTKSPFASSTSNMLKPFTLIALLALLPFLATVHAQVPTYPPVWDSIYPMNRCIDFCAFLRPGQICPAEPHNANCLCSVYNIRLPAVPTQTLSFAIWLLYLTCSAKNAGGRRTLLWRMTCNLS